MKNNNENQKPQKTKLGYEKFVTQPKEKYNYLIADYYRKHPIPLNQKMQITGTFLIQNVCPDIVIVDVDNKSSDKSLTYCQQVLCKKFIPPDTSNVYVERTVHNGLHIFLKNDLDMSKIVIKEQNRFCGILNSSGCKDEDYDIDLFVPNNTLSESFVLVAKPHTSGLTDMRDEHIHLAPQHIMSRYREKIDNETWKVSEMAILSQCTDFSKVSYTFSQYLEFLKNVQPQIKNVIQDILYSEKYIEVYKKQDLNKNQNINKKRGRKQKQYSIQELMTPLTPKNVQQTTSIQEEDINGEDADFDGIYLKGFVPNAESEEMLMSIILDCLNNVQIHNYAGTTIKNEITLLPLFRSIMTLKEDSQEVLVQQIFDTCVLTMKAKRNYFRQWQQVKQQQTPFKDLSIFFTMIKYNNKDKYENHKSYIQKYLKHIEENAIDKTRGIDFNDSIDYASVLRKLIRTQYFDVVSWFNDLKKVLIYILSTHTYYQKKQYTMKINRKNEIYYRLEEISEQTIKDQLSKFQFDDCSNLYGFMQQHLDYITYNNFQNSGNEDDYKVQVNFTSKPVQNDDLIQLYLQHIYNVLCRKNDVLYKYVLDLFSYYFQYPDDMSGVALVIIGPQGSGKNTITNPLIKLMGAYGGEVSKLDYVVGQFNPILENKHILVCNEMTNCDYNTKRASFDQLKSLITEGGITINQKGEKPRDITNMLNLIFLSNHDNPVMIEDGDRRYCVIRTGDKMDYSYYSQIYNSFEQPGFYEALLYYLLNRDISNFEPCENIPITEEKNRIIEYNMNQVQFFVIKSQIQTSQAKVLYANYMTFLEKFQPGFNHKTVCFKNFNSELSKFYLKKRTKEMDLLVLKPRYIQDIDPDYEYEKLTIEDYKRIQSEYSSYNSYNSSSITSKKFI